MPPTVSSLPRCVARAAAVFAAAIALPLVGCGRLPAAVPTAAGPASPAAGPMRPAAAKATALPADDRRVDVLVEAMRRHPVVLLGEVHDNAALHELRAQALRRLVEGGARPALLLEQFDRERQADIDRAAARPGADADAVIAAATVGRSQAMQGWRWEFYRPYIALALDYRLPLVAANVSRDDVRRIAAGAQAAGGTDAAVPADIAAAQAEAIVAGHCGLIGASQAGGMVAAQVARDRFMASSIEAQAGRGAVLLAGNGHVRADIGVPRWLAPATRARSVAIGLLEDDAGGAAAAAYDTVVAVSPQPRPDPCEGMTRPPVR